MKEIPNFPDYFADRDGSIFSRKRGELIKLKLFMGGHGYLRVNLSTPHDKHFQVAVHRLVLLAYQGEPGEGCEARHLNGIRTDNRRFNLTWGTRKEQTMDRFSHGTMNKKTPLQKSFVHPNSGDGNANTSLKPDDVRRIRDLAHSGMTQKEIAKMFDVWPMCISRIVRRERWDHIL